MQVRAFLLMVMADGGKTCHPAAFSVCAMSVANDVISASYETRPMFPHWPVNRLRCSAISDCCSLVRCLHATRSSILTRAIASSSARLRREAASLSIAYARSFALAASRCASAVPRCDSAILESNRFAPASAFAARVRASAAMPFRSDISLPDRLLVLKRAPNSIARAAIKTIRETLPSWCLRPSVFMVVKSAMNSPAQPKITNTSAAYSTHSQRFNEESSDEMTSELINGIKRHSEREQRSLIVCFGGLLAFLVMKVIALLRR